MDGKLNQAVLDIKYLLLDIWGELESEYCRNPWESDESSCLKFREIANRYEITEDNIFDGIDRETSTKYKRYLDIE